MTTSVDDVGRELIPPLACSAWPAYNRSLSFEFILGDLGDGFGRAPGDEDVVVQITTPSGGLHRTIVRAGASERVKLDQVALNLAREVLESRGCRAFWGLPTPERNIECWFDAGPKPRGVYLEAHRMADKGGLSPPMQFWRIKGDAPFARLIWLGDGDRLRFSHIPMIDNGDGMRFVDLVPVRARDFRSPPFAPTYGSSLAGLTLMYMSRNSIDAACATGRALVAKVIESDRTDTDDLLIAAAFVLEFGDFETAIKLSSWASDLPPARMLDAETAAYLQLVRSTISKSESKNPRLIRDVLGYLKSDDLPRLSTLIRWLRRVMDEDELMENRVTNLELLRNLDSSQLQLSYSGLTVDGALSAEAAGLKVSLGLTELKKKLEKQAQKIDDLNSSVPRFKPVDLPQAYPLKDNQDRPEHYKPRLKDRYDLEVKNTLRDLFGYTNIMQIPKLDKVVINMGVGEAALDSKKLTSAVAALTAISGQKPVTTKARKSIAGFKVRQGMAVGCKVTLRKERMFEFLDRLVTIALPRVKDFRGLNGKAFDGNGNFAMGLKEHTVFPEIDFDLTNEIWGMDIIICTTAGSNDEARALLEELNFPFRAFST